MYVCIVVRKKWIKSVRYSQTYSSFCSVHSEHRIVSLKIILRCSKAPKRHPMKQIGWPQVYNNKEPSQRFITEVHNRLSPLYDEQDSIDMNYNLLTSCTEEVALETLPKKPKRGIKPLNSLKSVKKLD